MTGIHWVRIRSQKKTRSSSRKYAFCQRNVFPRTGIIGYANLEPKAVIRREVRLDVRAAFSG